MKLSLFTLFALLSVFTLSSCRDHLTGPTQTPAASDTIAFWKFEGNVNDVSGNGHNGATNGNYSYVADRFGNSNKAIGLTGRGSYVSVPNQSDINFTGGDSYTISAWVQVLDNKPSAIVAKVPASQPPFGYSIMANSHVGYNPNPAGGDLAIVINDSLTGNYGTAFEGDHLLGKLTQNGTEDSSSFPGNWHLITLSVQAHTGFSVYFDSVLLTSVSTVNPLQPTMYMAPEIENDGPIIMGSQNNGGATNLDDILILHHAVTQLEVNARFHEGGWYEHTVNDTSTLPPPLSGAVLTGNKFVSARVEANSGLITFIDAGGVGATNVPPGKYLSYIDKSFLSIVCDTYLTPILDTGYYSNNNLVPTNVSIPIGQTRALPSYQWHYLGNAKTTKIGDTIRTVWKNLGEDVGFVPAFDFVQDVYPVEFDSSGQIVISVKVINHGSISHSFAAQFLKDGMISDGTNYANDNVFIVNSMETVGDQWKLYQGTVPTYYAAFNGDPRKDATIARAIAFLSDAAAPTPLGLISPSAVSHCNWPDAVEFGFGVPTQDGFPVNDMATLVQWPTVVISAGSTAEIMRTSYGTCQMPLSQMPIH